MDTITISNLELWTHIGIPAEERLKEQPVLVSLTIHKDLSDASTNDHLEGSIDYQEVVDLLKRKAQENSLHTLEAFATELANAVLENFETNKVDITVKKFVIPETEYVAVSLSLPRI